MTTKYKIVAVSTDGEYNAETVATTVHEQTAHMLLDHYCNHPDFDQHVIRLFKQDTKLDCIQEHEPLPQ